MIIYDYSQKKMEEFQIMIWEFQIMHGKILSYPLYSNNPTLESLGIIICQTMHVHFAPRGQKRMARGNSHGGKAPKPPRRLRRNWEELESERLGSQIGDKGFASPVFLSISGNIRMLG